MAGDVHCLRTIDDLTLDVLADVLDAPVRSFTTERIGSGQVSSTYRVHLDGDLDVRTVIVKLADPDHEVRRTGILTGQYRREVEFYQRVTQRLPQDSLTRCYHAAYDPEAGWLTLVLEDVAPASQGDQLAGCPPERAELVVRELAAIVAAAARHDDLDWLDVQPPITTATLTLLRPRFVARYAHLLTDDESRLVEDLVSQTDTWWANKPARRSITHGDFRLDNILFADDPSTGPHVLTIVDWATLMRGPVTEDLCYFIGGSLTPEDRRAHEERLVRIYHAELVRHGLVDLTWQECWDSYRWGAFSGVLMVLAASTIVSQTERGDELFLTMLRRHIAQIRDLGSAELLAQVHRRRLLVDPRDEHRHEPGTERYWNESWYLDAIDENGRDGAYLRMGYVPNLQETVLTAWIVSQGRPSVAVIDYAAPLPEQGMTVTTDAFTSEVDIVEPLKRVRVTIRGTGESFPDPAAALRGERGTPVPVEFDLEWETDGLPFMYPVTTRYEMPCRVRGAVRVGDEVRRIDGPGQRDHSWGDRNWWALNWTWASAHLDDRTRVQVIETRVPGLPILASGYSQRDGDLREILYTNARHDLPADRLPRRTVLNLDPTGAELRYEPFAYGPLRLTAPDGRICEFPRALARISTPDGRNGVGWIEWGENMPAPISGGPVRRALRGVGNRFRGVLGHLGSRVPVSAVARVMTSPVGPRIVDAVFRVLPAHLDPDYASTVDARIRFNILDDKGIRVRCYDLVLGVDAPPRVERPGPSTPEPRCALGLTGTDLALMGAGRLDTAEAVIDRRIVLEGDVLFMLVAAPILTGPTFPTQKPLADVS